MVFVPRLKDLFIGFLLFIATPSALYAQVEFPVAAQPFDQTAMFKRVVQQQVELELNCMRIVSELTDEQADVIREATEPLVTERAEEFVAAIATGDPSGASGMAGLSKPLNDCIAKAAKEQLSADALKAYTDDLAKRDSFQRRAAQRGYLVAMDELLSLSAKQFSSVAKIVMESWEDDWNAMGLMIGGSANGIMLIKEQIKKLPEDKMKAVLRDSQWEALNGMMDLPPMAMAQPGPLAELQGKAMSILRIEELQELCKLDDAQTEKLTEATDTALKDIVEKKTSAMNMQAGDPEAMMKMVEIMSQSVGSMMDKSDEWKEAIDSVLTKGQTKLYQKRIASREKQSKNAFFATTVTMVGQQAGGVTAAQQMQLAKMLPKHLKSSSIGMKQMMELGKIPEEAFKEILNEQQWSKISAMREAMNQQAAGVFQAAPQEVEIAE